MKHAVQHLQLRQPNDKKKNKVQGRTGNFNFHPSTCHHYNDKTHSFRRESRLDLTGLGTDPSLSTGGKSNLINPESVRSIIGPKRG